MPAVLTPSPPARGSKLDTTMRCVLPSSVIHGEERREAETGEIDARVFRLDDLS